MLYFSIQSTASWISIKFAAPVESIIGLLNPQIYSINGLFVISDEEILNTKLFGKIIDNPIGLAAGFDKSAEVYNEIFKIGFGFVEVGTVTPKKEYGN